VIVHRIEEGEDIEIVQKYDPDKLDYYRVDLRKSVIDRAVPPSKVLDPDPGLDETLPVIE
jgi:hypothetical protein